MDSVPVADCLNSTTYGTAFGVLRDSRRPRIASVPSPLQKADVTLASSTGSAGLVYVLFSCFSTS